MWSTRMWEKCRSALRFAGSTRPTKRRPRLGRRLALERLEDRRVLASGSVGWQEGWPGIEFLSPSAPTTSDVIDFAFLDATGNPAETDLDLSFDLANKTIDVEFLPKPGGVYGGEGVCGVIGQLEGLDAGVWTLRSLESSVSFTVSDGPPSSPAPQPWMTISDAVVTEGDAGAASANFNVSLSHASDQPVTVNYATGGPGGALPGNDYEAVAGTLTFSPGQTSQTISVPVYGDTRDEYTEIFYMDFRGPTNAVLVGGVASGLIVDDDPPPALTINDVTLAEGNSGTTSAVFTVSLSAASGKTVNVNLAARDGTAQAGNNDYVPWGSYLSFAPGETAKTVTIQVTGDMRDEYDENFVVDLWIDSLYAEYASIADGQGVGTILDDDPPPALSISDVSLAEGRSGVTYFVFTVSLSAASDKTVSVDYATANGTATTANSDYVATSGTLTFAPGETTKTITVQVKGDRKKEANETFYLNLSAALNALLEDGQGRGTILNDD
jgi:hypothetical protein